MFNPIVRDSFFGEFDSLINALAKTNKKYSIVENSSVPGANVSKDDKGYRIEIAAPGLSRGDFNIEVFDNNLTVSTENDCGKNENSLRQEYSYHKFSRSWALPKDVNVEGIQAEYIAGILNLNIPIKDVNINKTKKIEVN